MAKKRKFQVEKGGKSMRVWMAVLLSITVCTQMFGQSVSSSVSGVLLDPTGGAVPAASCKLTNQTTGIILTASSDANGLVRFATVPAGAYTLNVQSFGFKSLEIRDIAVTSSEIRTLGNLTLQLGEVRESVSVTAEAVELQLASAEKAGVVTGSQLNNIALKGRDFFAFMQTIPGIVDTRASREATRNDSVGSISINGARSNQKLFTVDGMVDFDTHSNGSMPFMPNMDAIAEVVTDVRSAGAARYIPKRNRDPWYELWDRRR
jgi:hypothetical protein